MSRKKYFLSIMILTAMLWYQPLFAYYENKLYCEPIPEGVRLYLSNTSDTVLLPCSVYLDTLKEILLAEYQQLLQLDQMVERGDDVDYRTTLYDEKLQLIKKLYTQRMMFLQTIYDFELLILQKFQTMVYDHLEKRLQAIEKVYDQLDPFDFNFTNQIKFLDNFKLTMNILQKTTSLDEFVSALKHYLLLDKQRQGK